MKKQLFFKKVITSFCIDLMLTGMLHAANYYVDPATGNINNPGTEASPWNTFQNVISAGKSLAPGDVVYLKNGNHGWPSITNRNNGGVVTIKAYPGHTPIINRLDMNNSSNWKFEGIKFYTSSTPPNTKDVPYLAPVYPLWDNTLVRLVSTSYVTFDNIYMCSIENASSWVANDWHYKAWSGISINTGSHHVTIKNGLFRNLNFVIDFVGTSANTLQDNVIDGFCGDGMRVATNCLLEYNVIKNAYVANKNHIDAIQGFASSNAVIRGNTIINTTANRSLVSYGFQGIGLFDGFFDNYVIENNFIVQTSWEAIAVYGARGCQIFNNTVLDNPLVTHEWGPPWLHVRHHKNFQPASNNVIRNNLVSTLNLDDRYGNVGVRSNNITAPNYSTYFVNANALDFRLKAGSPAINAGYASGAPTLDLNRFARSGNPDVGCFEYGTYEVGADTIAPTIPGTPLITGSTLASVTLNWAASSDNEGVLGYNIYANGSLAGTSATTTGTASGLDPGTQYTFTISAFDAANNESNQSSGTQGSTQSGSIISATTATASSYEAPDNVPANAIDGNLGTRWAADGDGQWLQLQLSGQANITDIGLAFYMGSERVYSFELQASNDGSNWNTIFNGSSSGTTNGIEMFNVTDATASYIRYFGHGNSVNTWNNVYEIKFYSAGPPDTIAPSTPGTPIVGTVTTSSVALSWSASTDDNGVSGYKVYVNGANPQTFAGNSGTVTGLTDNTPYTFTVSAYDNAGNESAQSGSVPATTPEITSVTSSTTWQSFQESTQTGEFTATFTAIPNGNNIDALTGLQNGSASTYGDMACIIRFNTGGTIDARDGGTYTASNTVSYTSGINYAFRVEVNVPSHTYSVYVTPAGGSEQTVALNFDFRSEQANVTQITGWTIYGYSGTHTVDNMTFSTGVDTQPPTVPTGLVAGTITTTTVDLSWNASTDIGGSSVAGYKVYTNGANPVTVTGTSTTITGLTAATAYNFTVSAFDTESNESAQSGALPVTTDNIPDTEAPTVPTGLAAGTVTTTTVTLSWNASTDNGGSGLAGYKIYINGSNPVSVTGTSTTISGLTAATSYNFTVSAVDGASNESAQSSSILVTTDEIVSGVTSSTAWQSFNLSTQTGTFTATFDAIPNGNNIDAVTGIQNGTATAYGNLACIIRFNTSGTIDARDGGVYAASNIVSYSSGVSYAFRVEVNVPSHTYSVYATPAGGSEQTVASNFDFRTEQVSVTQLTGWSLYAYVGSHTVSNMVFDDGSTPDTEAPSVPTGLASGTITSTSVALSWNASNDTGGSGLAGYKVYTDGANPVTVTGTSTTITGLSAETQYSFTVSAFDGASNESAQSSAEVVTTDEIPTAIDLITNGEFDNGTTAWVAGNYGGIASLAAVTGQGMSGTNAMQITISAAGTNSWDIQIYQDIAIESGKTYEISFMAKAAASRTMAAVIQDTESPYSEYWHQDVNLTTSAQSFGPYTFNSSTTDATCRFKFFVGGNASTIYVDNIIVNDVSQSSGAIEFAQSDASFKVYPNPLQGSELTLSVNGYNSEEVNVIITDIMGRTVHNEVITVSDYSTANINANLNSGLYVISVNGENVFNQQKLIVE